MSRTALLQSISRLAVVAASFLVAAPSPGAGLLLPNNVDSPPLAITDHSVRTEIDDLVARTVVRQTFHNGTDQRMEGTYIFPIPENADITGFAMTFKGEMIEGEVLPADDAKKIYEEIVRRARDPGLIEFIGSRLLRMRVFPIEPNSDTTIELSYQQVCRPLASGSGSGDTGLHAFHYPLRTVEAAGQKTPLRFSAVIRSGVALKSIWSPSHPVEVVRDGDHAALVAYETSDGSLDEDFLLLFDREDGDLGLSLVAHRPDGSDTGHFVLLLNPKSMWPEETPVHQDVIFVVDTSGSMSGEKIDQARDALAFCLGRLKAEDRFNIVRFSTGFDRLFTELVPADDEHLEKARATIEGFEAGGGTNIHDALQSAVRTLLDERDPERPQLLVFLTDGNGDRDRETIMKMMADLDASGIRLFPFGVGHDVNTILLDALAIGYRGKPTYVQPGEKLELVLGDFFSMLSRPVLTDLELTLPDIGATEIYPPVLGDLYHGQQLIVVGSYKSQAGGVVMLAGRRGGERIEYTWPAVDFGSTPEASYVSRLWAGRKIAYLIDRIRQSGETDELVGEVIALSQEYGIQTPYSSYLVAPEKGAWTSAGDRNVRLGQTAVPMRRVTDSRARLSSIRQSAGAAVDAAVAAPDAADDAVFFVEGEEVTLDEAMRGLQAEAGKAGNIVARAQVQLRDAESVAATGRAVAVVQKHGGRWFSRVDGILIDQTLEDDAAMHYVRFASDAYFELVAAFPEFRTAFAASRNVVLAISADEAIVILDAEDEQLADELTDDQRGRWFGDDD
jgi:uncharacterized protein YegL